MSAENKETSKEQSTPPVEVVKSEISSMAFEPRPKISEDIKNLLNSMLKKTLDKRITRLENRYQEQKKYNELTAKNFKTFTLQLQSLVKNMEQTLKKKESKKKEETPKLKVNLKKHLSSKSLPHGKKLKINKPEYNTTKRTESKQFLNTTNYKTENNNKVSHKRIKSLKDTRVLSEANIKKEKIKLEKKALHNSLIKDDKKEDIKAKTMRNYHNKSKTKDKINKKNDELTKTFSETNIHDKTQKNKEKFIKSEKKEKKNMTHFQTKSNVIIYKREKPEKKVEKDIKKSNTTRKEAVKKEAKKEEKKGEVKKEEPKKEEKNKGEEPKKENIKQEEAKKEETNKDEKKEEEKPKEENKIKEEAKQNQENIKKEENINNNIEKEQPKETKEEPKEKKDETPSEPPQKEEIQKPPETKIPELNKENNIDSNKEEIKSEEIKPEQPQSSSPPVDIEKKEEENKNIEESKKEENTNNEEKNEILAEGNNDKLIEEFKKEYIEKVKDEMTSNCELHNITLNPMLNQSLNSSMSFSQSFLLSKSMVEEPLPKLPPRDPNKPLTMDEIIKDFKNAFIYVLDFLNLQEKIAFTGIHRGFKAERTYLFNLKRDEIISSLELKDRETLDDRIVQFKLNHSQKDISKPFGEFSVSKAAAKTVVLLNNDLYSKLFKTPILDDNLSDIYIIYRLLFVLLGEHEIADIMDDRLFWVKCTEYLITKSNGKIGTFIVEKSQNFDFSHKSICLMNRLLVGIKPKIIPTTFTKISGTTGLLFFLIKDSLEYCGVLINEKKTPASRIYDNLMHYKNLISSLDKYIDFLSKIKLMNK